MIHELKRFDKHGKLIEVIPAEKLRQDYWAYFNNKKSDYKNSLGVSPCKQTAPREKIND